MIQTILDIISTIMTYFVKDDEGDSFDVDLIKKWEGLELEAYRDVGGIWTIGYGHTKTAKQGMVITEGQAEELLWRDVEWAEAAVDQLVTVPLNFDQKSALVSFVYNVGRGAFAGSTLLRKLNAGDYYGAGRELLRWNKVKGKYVQGLMNRRKDELQRFSHGD